MFKIGDKDCKLILLDTNILREAILNTHEAGAGFLTSFFIKNDNYAPCFSFMNVIELKPYKDIYEKFLNYFDIMSCIMFYLPQAILKKEYSVYIGQEECVLGFDIMRTSSPFFKNPSLKLRGFLESTWTELGDAIQIMLDEIKKSVQSWELQRLGSQLESTVNPEYHVNMEYYLSKEKAAIIKDLHSFGVKISPDVDIDIKGFPGARMMEFAQFKKTYLSRKAITKNDVLDVTISCIIPYVDAVITEASMAEIYKQAKSIIPQTKELEIYTLRDIRCHP